MARWFSEADVDPGLLRSRTVAVLGYGNQGHAHALNLRESGVPVVVGAREGQGAEAARTAGFRVLPIDEAVGEGDWVSVCLPDTLTGEIYAQAIGPHLRKGQTLVFVHGFALRFGLVSPPPDVDVVLVAPKGPGAQLRSRFVAGSGLAAMVGCHQDSSGTALGRALAYANGLGCFRVGVFQTTVAEETECDLFGEQAVLCGGMIEVIKAGYQTLVEAGYSPEAAYFECVHETQFVIQLLVERGLVGMRQAISDTAEWGAYEASGRVVNESVRAAMKGLLEDVRSGGFARAWIAETDSGSQELKRRREAEALLSLNRVGDDLRARLSGGS